MQGLNLPRPRSLGWMGSKLGANILSGQLVAFYYDNTSSEIAEVYYFSEKLYLEKRN